MWDSRGFWLWGLWMAASFFFVGCVCVCVCGVWGVIGFLREGVQGDRYLGNLREA